MSDAPAGFAQPLFLIIRDSYDNWGFPKGHVEIGEQPEAAALREVTEETGLESLTVPAVSKQSTGTFASAGGSSTRSVTSI